MLNFVPTLILLSKKTCQNITEALKEGMLCSLQPWASCLHSDLLYSTYLPIHFRALKSQYHSDAQIVSAVSLTMF